MLHSPELPTTSGVSDVPVTLSVKKDSGSPHTGREQAGRNTHLGHLTARQHIAIYGAVGVESSLEPEGPVEGREERLEPAERRAAVSRVDELVESDLAR